MRILQRNRIWPIILVMASLLNAIKAADEFIDCSNDELVSSIFNEPIDLTASGIIKIYENVSISEIRSTSNNEFSKNYIDARLEIDDNQIKNLIIFATEQFTEYANEQTATRISLKINMGCEMGRERVAVFFQPLKEGNYFSPVFSQSRYELQLPTPLFAGFELTSLVEISARDDDLTHNQIIFTSSDSLKYFISVTTQNITSADKKTYFARITLEKIYMELPEQMEFEITAMDNGEPQNVAKALIVLQPDLVRSLPRQPKFQFQLYKALIDVDLTMQPLQIQLLNGSYSNDVNFALTIDENNFANYFALNDFQNGSVRIQLNTAAEVNRTELLQKKSLNLILTAEHRQLMEPAVAAIVVELMSIEAYFHFMSYFYEGSVNATGVLNMTHIVFNPYIYKEDIQFKFLENPGNYFQFQQNNFMIQLQLNDTINLENVQNTERFLRLTLQASWELYTAHTYVIIKLPEPARQTEKEEERLKIIEFEEPYYIANLSINNHEFTMETIQLRTSSNESVLAQIEYNLQGEMETLFNVTRLNQTNIKIDLRNSTQNLKDLKFNESLVLLLTAQYNGTIQSSATIIANFKQEISSNSEMQKPFSSVWIQGRIELQNETTQILKIDSVQLNPLNNLKEYNFYLEGDQRSHFLVREDVLSMKLDLILQTAFDQEILESNNFLNLEIHAVLPGIPEANQTLLVIVELPKKDCPVPTETIPEPPEFSSSQYVFNAYTNQTGSLGIVSAYSKGANNATFSYILQIENDKLAQKLSINPFTGELMLYGNIDEGRYLFNITAQHLETQGSATVKCLLSVEKKQECSILEVDGSDRVTVKKTLEIQHIKEEQHHHGLMNLTLNENCTFRIQEIWPNDKEYVYVNETTSMLDAIAIDREASIFETMKQAKIIVKLKLICIQHSESGLNNSSRQKRDLITDEELQHNLMPSQDIPYSHDTMWLHLIIDDINDHSPEFDIPQKGHPLYLGYPMGNISYDFYPEYLLQVKASDRDLNENAEIYYSLRTNSYFDIEEKTGKIYAKGYAMPAAQQTELIVVATDQHGKGLATACILIVKALSMDYYGLITMNVNTSKNTEDLEKQLTAEMNYDVKILKISYIPKQQQPAAARQSLEESKNLTCKIWIYAFEEEQPVKCDEVKGKFLMQQPDQTIITIETYEEVGYPSYPIAGGIEANESTDLVYVIIITLLGVVTVSTTVFIIWQHSRNHGGSLKKDCIGVQKEIDEKNTAIVNSGSNGNVNENFSGHSATILTVAGKNDCRENFETLQAVATFQEEDDDADCPCNGSDADSAYYFAPPPPPPPRLSSLDCSNREEK